MTTIDSAVSRRFLQRNSAVSLSTKICLFNNLCYTLFMLKIRLQRIGRKNDPSFRAVLTDSKNSTKSGKFLEILGTYNPKAGEKNLKTDRIKYWMSKGAKPSDTMHNFLVHDKVVSGKKINVLPKKKPTVKRKELKAKK
ncbi:MAG: 30S ribosomal protein S16 [Minisyncoccia bacterium]